MRILLSFLLSLVLSVSYGQGAFRMAMLRSKEYVEPTLSAPSFASGGDFTTGREYYIYKLRGYDQAAAGSLPLMVFWGGFGMRDGANPSQDWDNRVNEGEGLYYFLANGSWDDLTYGHIVVVAQYDETEVSPTPTQFDALLDELDAEGVKYDPNRISVTGLSGGGIGARDVFLARPTQVASATVISAFNTTDNWDDWEAIQTPGFWQHHGADDGLFIRTIGGTLYFGNGGGGAWNELTPAIRGSYYYDLGHDASVWNDKVYDPDVAPYNFFQWAAKFNIDNTLQATQFVDNAEATLDIVDYREALQQTNLLTAGSPKTALLARLATLLTTLNQGGQRFYVSPQTSGIGSLGSEYNIWTSFTTSAGITNITDITGASSTIDVTMSQQCASGTRDGNISNPNKHKAHGFSNYLINTSGFKVESAVNDGSVTISGIPTGEYVDIFIYSHNVTAYDDDFSADNTLQTTVNSVVKTQYVAYNNYQSISYLDVAESSGNVVIYFDALGSRELLITGIEILRHP